MSTSSELGTNTAVIPVEPEDDRGDSKWICVHKRFMTDALEQEPEVIFIGDFLVARVAHTEAWDKYFAPMHSLNFGIAEDKTQNILWRIKNGELDQTHPRVIVLSAGANNIMNSSEQIATGIAACVEAIMEKKPDVTLVVLKILPCGQHPNPMRLKTKVASNMLPDMLQKYENVQVLDIDPGFVAADETISHHDMYDYLHLTRQGMKKAFEILADLLQQLLTEEITLD